MTLALSQSLFSSAAVDRGTQLLLKSLTALWPTLAPQPRTLDLGCGCGVLGIALAMEGARVIFRDRDALAVAVSCYNCNANGVQPALLEGGLDLAGLQGPPFDLIVSNLPAKAGEPVHGAMMRGIRRNLAPDGSTVFVVVAPLEGRLAAALAEAGLEGQVVERTATHAVFHARAKGGPPEDTPDPDPLAPYHRQDSSFRAAGVEYRLAAVHDLPEFDTLGCPTRLAMDTMRSLARGLPGPVLVWNPGQGHVPLWLARRTPAHAPPEVTVAGRDLLSLEATRRNAADVVKRAVHTWHPGDAGGGYGTFILFPDDDPAARWEVRLPEVAADALLPGGRLVLSAGSTFVGRFLRASRGWRELCSRKMSGSRCVVLERVSGASARWAAT